MSSPIALPTDMLLGQAQSAATSAKDLASRKRIDDAAKSFESTFLSMMLQPMFASVASDGPFGGGEGEAMFKSFLTDAIAKQATKQGGLGIADTVQREMLKLQGLK